MPLPSAQPPTIYPDLMPAPAPVLVPPPLVAPPLATLPVTVPPQAARAAAPPAITSPPPVLMNGMHTEPATQSYQKPANTVVPRSASYQQPAAVSASYQQPAAASASYQQPAPTASLVGTTRHTPLFLEYQQTPDLTHFYKPLT